jgi:hypothetical protein
MLFFQADLLRKIFRCPIIVNDPETSEYYVYLGLLMRNIS